jgi:hypothetical protein
MSKEGAIMTAKSWEEVETKVMEKSCENCGWKDNGCPILEGICNDLCMWKPNYPTLEQENAELIASFNELNREYAEDIEKQNVNLSVINVKAAQLEQENAELKVKLEAYELLYKTEQKNHDDTIDRNCKVIRDSETALNNACVMISESNQALERACEWQAKSIVDDGYRCCNFCPFQLNKKICLKYLGGCNFESLKVALIKYFKEEI